MTIIKYSEPVPFHKAMPGAKSVVIMKRDDDEFTPAVATTAKPINRKPKVRRDGRNVAIDDEDVVIPAAKRGNTMTDYDYDTSRGRTTPCLIRWPVLGRR
jgi:hypothetical protein